MPEPPPASKAGSTIAVCPVCGIDVTGMALFDYSDHLAYDHSDEADIDDGSDMDPCNYCPHDNTDHRGDGCLYCGCVAAQ